MGEQNFVLERSIERYKEENLGLAKALGVPELAQTLNQNIPDTVESLNNEAHKIGQLASEAERYMEAQEVLAAYEGRNFGQAERLAAAQNFPDTPDAAAQAAFDLEQKVPADFAEQRAVQQAVETYRNNFEILNGGLPANEEYSVRGQDAWKNTEQGQSYDVIAQGRMSSPIGEDLKAGFARADAHAGAQSLETLRTEKIAQVYTPAANDEVYTLAMS